MAVSINALIPRFLNTKLDWQQSLMKQWPAIVGTLQTRIRLEKIHDTTIVIGVYESHWMQELYLLSSVIIDSINNFLGEPKIQAVRFVLVEERPKAVPWAYKPATSSLPSRNLDLNEQQKNALAAINDSELRQWLVHFLERTRQWDV